MRNYNRKQLEIIVKEITGKNATAIKWEFGSSDDDSYFVGHIPRNNKFVFHCFYDVLNETYAYQIEQRNAYNRATLMDLFDTMKSNKKLFVSQSFTALSDEDSDYQQVFEIGLKHVIAYNDSEREMELIEFSKIQNCRIREVSV